MHHDGLIQVGERDHVAGPPQAPLELVEYGDFECPYCREAFPEVERIRAELGERLRFVFRHFPLPKHRHAKLAAEAAEAAGAQGAFWATYRLLFTRRDALELRDPEGLADELGIDVARFVRDVSGHAFATQVEAQMRGGLRSGVQGTPTFFINGRKFEGEWRDGGLLAAIGGDTEAAWY